MDQNDTDAELVAAWVRGDASALAAVYDRYAGQLYAFGLSRTRSAADAADLVQDTFVRAANRVAQLRDPSALRPWLYAIARRRLFDRSNGRTTVNDDDTIAGLVAAGEEPTAALVRDEVRDLVWAAADSLNDRDRDLLELHLRQGLEGAELAAVVGVTPAHVYTLVNRVKERMAKAVGALLVARHGRAECDQLAGLLRGWDGRFTLDVRSRVTRHVESCDVCERKRTALVVPANFAAGAMAVPVVLLPASLRDRTLDAVFHGPSPASGPGTGRGTGPEQGAGRWRADGFPRAAVRGTRRLAVLVGAGVASLLVVAGLAVTTLADRDDTEADAADVPATSVTSMPAVPAGAAPAPGSTIDDVDVVEDPSVTVTTPTADTSSVDGAIPNTVAARPPTTPGKDASNAPGERESDQPAFTTAPPSPTSPAGAPSTTGSSGGASPGGATPTTRPPTTGTNPPSVTVPPTQPAPPTTVAPPAGTTAPPAQTAPPTTTAPPRSRSCPPMHRCGRMTSPRCWRR